MICEKCQEVTVLGLSHMCAPAWLVWCTDLGLEEGDADTVYAHRPERAAERWAEDYDRRNADYAIVRGSDVEVLVRPRIGVHGEPLRMLVTGETVPVYSAVEVRS